MLKNHLKIVLRGLLKNKSYSLLNIFGLAIGITCASLILLWVEDEVTYDDHFSNKNEVHFILTNQKFDGKTYTFGSTPAKMAPALKKEVPGVELAARYANSKELFTYKDNTLYKYGGYVDTDFLEIFSLNFLEGNAKNAFDDVNGIIITRKTAKQFFGEGKSVVGKALKVNNSETCKVTGVVEDFPDNVTMKFEWLRFFEPYAVGKQYYENWNNNSLSTYVQLTKNADFDAVNKQVIAMIPEKKGGEDRVYGFLQSMKDWRLRGEYEEGKQVGGRIKYVRLFSLIALVILAIACINFMNLSTARSEKRANEVGVRKVLGSSRKHLIIQFFNESIIIALIAGVLSICLIYIILPSFNQIINKELTIGLSSPLHLMVLGGIILFCGLLSGLYPAFYLSSFSPASILKGIKKAKGGSIFVRNGLVVTQFAVSVILIISTVIVYTQIRYVQNRDLGFDKDNLVAIKIQGEVVEQYRSLKSDILDTGMAEKVGLNMKGILRGGYNGWGFKWKGMPEEANPLISLRWTDKDFFETAGIKILEGKGFDENPNDDSSNVIITRSFADLIGGDVVGKYLWRDGNVENKMLIIGVVNDYQYGSMYEKSDPVIFFNDPTKAKLMYVRIKDNVTTNDALDAFANVMKEKNPAFPFEYNFVDQQFNNKFKSEKLIERLSQIFAILTVLISCFGLFGLAAYTAEQRNKEIGIRKVLGASVSSIVNLLSKEFLKLVLLAIVIAIPIAWILMNNWLESYKFRIEISWWMFVMAAVLAIVIALFTVSFQAIKAAVQNPVKSIRTE